MRIREVYVTNGLYCREKIRYFQNYFETHETNIKMLWTDIKSIVNTKSKNQFSQISHLLDNGKQIDDPVKVNHQQPSSAQLRPIQKIPTPIKLLISPVPEMINQICEKYSLENAQDKKTNDDTSAIF